MSLTDEAKVKVFGEVIEAVGDTLRQYAHERSKGDCESFAEITEASSNALVATIMCMRLGMVGVEIDDDDDEPGVINELSREASEAIWDIVERFEAEHRNSK